jgi:hypothetical protein
MAFLSWEGFQENWAILTTALWEFLGDTGVLRVLYDSDSTSDNAKPMILLAKMLIYKD